MEQRTRVNLSGNGTMEGSGSFTPSYTLAIETGLIRALPLSAP